MNSIEDEVKAKVKSLRATYSRENKKKKKKKTGTGTDKVDLSTWKFFESLQFLNDFIIPKTSLSNLQEVMKCM